MAQENSTSRKYQKVAQRIQVAWSSLQSKPPDFQITITVESLICDIRNCWRHRWKYSPTIGSNHLFHLLPDLLLQETCHFLPCTLLVRYIYYGRQRAGIANCYGRGRGRGRDRCEDLRINCRFRLPTYIGRQLLCEDDDHTNCCERDCFLKTPSQM